MKLVDFVYIGSPPITQVSLACPSAEDKNKMKERCPASESKFLSRRSSSALLSLVVRAELAIVLIFEMHLAQAGLEFAIILPLGLELHKCPAPPGSL